MQSQETLPHIGQTIDFYPTPSERNAAFIVQVFETDDESRPAVALLQLAPNGDLIFHEKIQPADPELNGDEECPLEGRWGFHHEFYLQQADDHEETSELGSQTNKFVGIGELI